jgi:hypothetical protein
MTQLINLSDLAAAYNYQNATSINLHSSNLIEPLPPTYQNIQENPFEQLPLPPPPLSQRETISNANLSHQS